MGQPRFAEKGLDREATLFSKCFTFRSLVEKGMVPEGKKKPRGKRGTKIERAGSLTSLEKCLRASSGLGHMQTPLRDTGAKL